MVDFGKVFLLLCVMMCLVYIYWMHHKKEEDVVEKNKSKKKYNEREEDNLSFLGSHYELELTKGDDSLLEEELDEQH